MKKLSVYLSKDAPNIKDVLWLKPVEGGVSLKVLFNGKWNGLKVINDTEATDNVEESIQSLIGSVQDGKEANTINGAKAYAKDATDAVVGTSDDTSEDLTLNGLKAYIDEKIAE